jgi:hypothetical protein
MGLDGYSNRGYSDPWMLRDKSDSMTFQNSASAVALTGFDYSIINEITCKNMKISVNNGDIINITDPGAYYYTGNSTIFVFGYRSASGSHTGSPTQRIDLYALTFFDSDGETILANFIPCRSPQNEIGVYDTISEKFISSSGGSSFKAGPAADGYWEFEYSIPGNLFSSTQFAALNSGINSTKVEQIETNKNNISLVETKANTNATILSQTYNSADCNMSIYLYQDNGAIDNSTYYMTDQSKMHFKVRHFRRLVRYWKDGVEYQKYRWSSIGVIATNNSAKKDMLTLDIPGVTDETYVKVSILDDDGINTSMGFIWQKSSVNPGDVWYIRPHIKYTDLETGMEYTMYGAVYKVTVGTPCTIECDTLSCTELTQIVGDINSVLEEVL